MRGLRVLTILCACAASGPAAAQVPEPPAAPAPFVTAAPPAAPAPLAVPAPASAPAPPGPAMRATPTAPAAQAAPAQPGQAPQPPQQPRPAPTRQTEPAPRPPQAPPAPPGTAAPPAPFAPEAPGQLLNIQVDVTITAEGQGEPQVKKVVSVTVADRQVGFVRSNDTRNPGFGDTLNVDVQPSLQRNGQILTRVGLEYANGKQPPVVQLRAQPLLEPGRSLLISRAASPNTDRTVTVEVVARVLK